MRKSSINKFPEKGETIKIEEKMCDFNNHMNVVFYQHIMEKGGTQFYQDLGFNKSYLEQGFSSFTLESNIRYLRELRLGQEATPYHRIIKFNKKLIHYAVIIVSDSFQISCFSEHVIAHIDMNIRKTAEMPQIFLDQLQSMKIVHDRCGDLNVNIRLSIK